jgi:hypothetical protein
MDRDFLLGVIAVQLGQATPAQVMAAASAFVADRSRSIPERLLAEGVFTPERLQVLSALVQMARAAGEPQSVERACPEIPAERLPVAGAPVVGYLDVCTPFIDAPRLQRSPPDVTALK